MSEQYADQLEIGEVYRAFLYVDDVAEGCLFIMENIESGKMKEISSDYFVKLGKGEDIKLKDLALLVKNIVGFEGEIRYDSSKPDGIPRKLLDVSKIRELGWKAKVSLDKGIQRMYQRTYNSYRDGDFK